MMMRESKLKKYSITKVTLFVTFITIVFSVVLTDTLMIFLGASWFDIGTALAIICPLLGTPPIVYVFMKLQKDLTESNDNLEKALSEVKTLKGLLPICSNCKGIRDKEDSWTRLESYIETHSDAAFTHSICPDCSNKLYGDILRESTLRRNATVEKVEGKT